VRLYDVWMGAKLLNGTTRVWLNGSLIEQDPLGGRGQQQRVQQEQAQQGSQQGAQVNPIRSIYRPRSLCIYI